jgi:hypothetical protein
MLIEKIAEQDTYGQPKEPVYIHRCGVQIWPGMNIIPEQLRSEVMKDDHFRTMVQLGKMVVLPYKRERSKDEEPITITNVPEKDGFAELALMDISDVIPIVKKIQHPAVLEAIINHDERAAVVVEAVGVINKMKAEAEAEYSGQLKGSHQ